MSLYTTSSKKQPFFSGFDIRGGSGYNVENCAKEKEE
jgi:hypothetical protein